MKKLSLIVAALVFTICIAAQLNYMAAIQDARQCDGTDLAIEQAMYSHGFDVDAMDTTPITFWQKISAILP